jgi:MFS family permease
MGLILPVVVLKYHWRLGWFVLGIAGLLLIFLNSLFVRDRPAEVGLTPWGGSRQEGRGDIFSPARKMRTGEILASGTFWLIGLSYFAISYGTYSIVDFSVTYGAIELEIPYPVASLFITVIAFSGVFGSFLLMALSDAIGRKKSLVIIQLLLSLGILHLLWAGDKVWSLMVGMGFFGFLYGAIWPMYGACASDFFPKEMTGRVFGLMTIFYGVGGMSSPPLTGYLADLTGTFRWPFGLGALASLLAALLIGFLKTPVGFPKDKD